MPDSIVDAVVDSMVDSVVESVAGATDPFVAEDEIPVELHAANATDTATNTDILTGRNVLARTGRRQVDLTGSMVGRAILPRGLHVVRRMFLSGNVCS